MAKVDKLRAQHTTFTYENYSWELQGNDLEIKFHYTLSPDIEFHPSATIHSVTQDMINSLGSQRIDEYVFQIGMAEIFSYWKTAASPMIHINAGFLSQDARKFWHKLLLKGMGEFFYTNSIDFSQEDFVTFSGNQENQKKADTVKTKQFKVLIPIGGGKDSTVCLEILKKSFSVGTYTVSAPLAAQSVIDTSKIPLENQIRITRIIDPKVFELNENGYLNGHVPISAYLAFLSYLTADLFNYTHIAISNERSSNEGNVWYCDQEINHQYSKTYEFERDLQVYAKKYLPANAPFYFSFMRPLYELQIAQLFADLPEHHQIFRSCNKGQKENVWCGRCSKCLFAWTILFPFLGPEKLTTYFGKNLFEDNSLWPIAQELLGLSTTKPFDCVGTHEETIIAFYLSTKYYETTSNQQQNFLVNQKLEKGHKKYLPILLEKIDEELKTNPKLKIGPTGEVDYEKRASALLNGWNAENSLPQNFIDILKTEIKKSRLNAPNP